MLADALSPVYSDNSPGAVEAHSECAYLDIVDNDTSAVCKHSEECSLPMIVGLEARVITRRKPPRSESSCDSATWMKDHFILHSPQERKEGGSTTESAESSTAEPENSPVASNEPELVMTSDNAVNIVPSLDQSPADVLSLIGLIT